MFKICPSSGFANMFTTSLHLVDFSLLYQQICYIFFEELVNCVGFLFFSLFSVIQEFFFFILISFKFKFGSFLCSNVHFLNRYLATASLEQLSEEMLTDYKRRLSSDTSLQSSIQDRQSLPVHAMKGQIMEAINDNPVIIIRGNTGCGKFETLMPCLFIGNCLFYH